MSYYCCQIPFAGPAYDEAFQIRNELLRKPLGLVFEPKDIANEYLEHHFAIFNAVDEMLGTVILKPLEDPSTLKLRQMAILEKYQGQNMGRRLIVDVEQWVKRKGFAKIELHARKTAVGFYGTLGYQIEGEEFMEVGIAHRKMYKSFD